MSKRVLVLGGSGFVGRSLVPRLLADGHDVTLLNRGSRQVPGVTQLRADRGVAGAMVAVADGLPAFDTVVDTSAYTRRQAEVAWRCFGERARAWLHLGSASVYRDRSDTPPDEESPIGGAPVWGEYGVDKSDIDTFLLGQRTSASVTILRPPYLYGPGNDNARETYVMGRVLRGLPVVVPGDGTTPIQFLHVDDLADAIVLLVRSAPEGASVFNIAAAPILSLQGWVEAVAAVCGPSAHTISVLVGAHAGEHPPRRYFPFRDFPCWVDARRIQTVLGWEPRYAFDAGIRQTWESYDPRELASSGVTMGVEDEILATVRRAAPRDAHR